MGDLSDHFSSHEFACKCGCGYDEVDPELINLLEKMRSFIGGAVRINSGCRCENHNNAVGGARHSVHKLGQAADIMVGGGWHRRRVLDAAVACGAEGIGVARTFIHVDVHEGTADVPRPSAWTY